MNDIHFPDEPIGRALKLVCGERLVQIIHGASVDDVKANLIEWLDEQPVEALEGITVEVAPQRRYTLSFTATGVVLTTARTQREYTIFGAARDAFAECAIKPLNGWQWM